jgi:hypothetical protein
MPFAGLGLHIVIALFCAFHVVRTGQPMYWLFILFAFPLLGSIVYFVAVYLPASRLQRSAFKAASAAVRVIDPTRDVRAARAAFDDTPTAQNQMRLAAALLESGEAEEAARLYEAALTGPFASDPEIRWGAGRAATECGRFMQALPHLAALRADRPDYRAESVALLLARCWAGTGQPEKAREEFEGAVAKFGTFEAHAEYEIWALSVGDTATAERLQQQIDRITARWKSINRELNAPALRRLKQAQEAARRQG